MSNNTVKGVAVKIEVAATYATAKPATAITAGSAPVITATTHGVAKGEVFYVTAETGMPEIDGQVLRADTVTTDTITVAGIDTTNFIPFSAGTLTKVATWVTLDNATSYDQAGGEADKLDETTLIDTIKQEVSGLMAAQTVTIAINQRDTATAAQQILEAAAWAQQYVVVRITTPGGGQRIYHGQPSVSGESLQKGAIATGSIQFTVKGRVLRLGPVPA